MSMTGSLLSGSKREECTIVTQGWRMGLGMVVILGRELDPGRAWGELCRVKGMSWGRS
jgi:hypothetical protein